MTGTGSFTDEFSAMRSHRSANRAIQLARFRNGSGEQALALCLEAQVRERGGGGRHGEERQDPTPEA